MFNLTTKTSKKGRAPGIRNSLNNSRLEWNAHRHVGFPLCYLGLDDPHLLPPRPSSELVVMVLCFFFYSPTPDP
ncbi:unnamed protein product [Allacma fusca]|uniref:Uncharacterized protein n=1 Tax=Allacma fusca TaxID=39272 RepID=A0A8J2JJL3_9HEXA|nr:unnamed protein product [Allacma fusca]